ncbi:MAG: peptidase [Candidatus Glassbacteria bacterium GWA2_58_10]|uniref:Peptidase n=1 Tax=Candidatus Glassbacteria bacterium GWA2_58_10 TaxID=1817865 RepID=A0A1F5YDU9_9BACT|nr:MAG: peptidase [Candidatus Glassbacteria bacterium GWA2_58_10]
MRKKYLLFCLLACLTAVPLLSQKEKPPEGGAPKDFVLPERQAFTLDNGLAATLVQFGDLPKVTVRVVLRAGNLNEAADEVWLADLTGNLLKEGTTTRSAEQIADQAGGMGGVIDVAVDADQTTISADVLSEFGSRLVPLIADIARNPLLPQSEIERLKADLQRNLSIEKSQPQSIALESFRKALYPGHPYGRVFPTEEMIRTYTVEKVRGFYQRNFGAARAHVYVAGRFDGSAVEKALREAFGDWTRGPEPLLNPPAPRTEHIIHLIDRPGAPQSTLYLGLPVVDPSSPDFMSLQVTNALLGGVFSSRITTNIREDKGYTYSPHSSISARYRDAYWLESADVTTEVTGASLKEIFYEIGRLQKEAPPAEELSGIQNYMAGTFVLRNSQRGDIISQLAFLDLHGLGIDYLTNYVRNIMAVTPEQVQKMTQTYLQDQKMTLVVVGDKAKVEAQLKPYGPLAAN